VLEAGGYIATALIAVQVVLIFSLVRGKTTKGVFAIVSPVIVFAAAFFWMGDRVTEMTIRGVGTIKTAVNIANQYVEDIRIIKDDLEKQKQELTAEIAKRRARTLTKEQYDALQALKGRVPKINVMFESAVEPSLFATQIINALMDAGVDVKVYPAAPGQAWTGNMVYWTGFANDPKDDPLVGPFIKANLYGGHGQINILLGEIPKDAPLLMIGERYAEMNGSFYIPPAKK
jgi:hypothetical protein